MAKVIIKELAAIKKEYARPRRTGVENAQAVVFEEKKVEEMEVVFLMDRFGYSRTVDMSVYERNKEAADAENKYVITCMNTDKICIFTDSGKQHLIKVMDVPYGKFRDKGTPVDNLCNYDSTQEELILAESLQKVKFATLLFGTAQGMLKQVDGGEFDVAKGTIAATKLQEGGQGGYGSLPGADPADCATDKAGILFCALLLRRCLRRKRALWACKWGNPPLPGDQVEDVYCLDAQSDVTAAYGEKGSAFEPSADWKAGYQGRQDKSLK